MKKTLASLVLLLVAGAFAAPVDAQGFPIHGPLPFSFSSPAAAVYSSSPAYVPAPTRYYSPSVSYYSGPPAYYAGPPVYAGPPAVYFPAPIVVAPVYGSYYRGHSWRRRPLRVFPGPVVFPW